MSKIVRVLLLVVLVAAVCVDVAQPRDAPVRLERALWSPAVKGRLRLGIYLPTGYASARQRYPVVYFLHGLPAASTSFRGADFLARALEASGRKAIVVAPQGARDNDSDPEYLDWGTGRNWETAITRDIVGYVDSHFRTIPQRRGRAIVGLSAGGYGRSSSHSTISQRSRWSSRGAATSIRRIRGACTRSISARRARTRTRARTRSSGRCVVRSPVGRRTSPSTSVAATSASATRTSDSTRARRRARAARVPVYAGGHEQSVWTSHARAWLALAVDHLRPPRAGG